MKNAIDMIWLNGNIQPASNAISASDRGFLLGDGVFDTILIHQKTPIFLEQHLQRLKHGLFALRIAPVDFDHIKRGLSELIEGRDENSKDLIARITITRGAIGRGLSPVPEEDQTPTIVIALSEAPSSPSQPITLLISERVRFSRASALKCKLISAYQENILARYDADRAGFDDALLLNERGEIVCATTGNVFLIAGDVLRTPSLDAGALQGIVRQTVLEAASEIGISVDQSPIFSNDLKQSSLFLTNSIIGLRLAASAPQKSPKPCEIFSKLAERYERRISQEIGKG